MFIPGSTPTNTNLSITSSTMNNNFFLHHNQQQQQQQQQPQQSFFDNLKDPRSTKLSSAMSKKSSANQNFSLDPDLLRELNARYLHDISAARPSNGTNPNLDNNMFPALLLPSFLRAEHYHQHTHTHEHNLNIFTPPSNPSFHPTLNSSSLDKLSKSDNSLSSVLRTTTANNFSSPSLLPPTGLPPMLPPFNPMNSSSSLSAPPPAITTTTSSTMNSTTHHNHSTPTKATASSQTKKSSKWCAAHVRISWMIYHQQQRSKDKLSPTDNRKDNDGEQKHPHQPSSSSLLSNKLSDPVPASKSSILPALHSSSTSDLSLPLPVGYQPTMLPPPAFNFRSPFEFAGIPNGPFGRILPSSNTAFGGLGSLFPPPPLPPPLLPSPSSSSSSSSMIDRKLDINGSLAATANLGLDWTRLQRSMGTPFVPPLPLISNNNENFSSKKLDESHNSNNEKKRSSSALNNNEDERRNVHHSIHPPMHLSNSNHLTNRSRSRSPHRSSHQNTNHSSLNNSNKSSGSSSTPPPVSSSSSLRKRTSPINRSINPDSFKLTSHSSSSVSVPLTIPPTSFSGLDPLTLSMIERQRLSAAYASLVGLPTGTNNFFPPNFDPTHLRSNSSSSLFNNTDSSSVMAAALLQREQLLNSFRFSQQHQNLERERAAAATLASISSSLPSTNKDKVSKVNVTKTEQTSPKLTEESARISPKTLTSPGSHSSNSSSSRSSSSKKSSHVKRVKPSFSPSPLPIPMESQEINVKQETAIELTPSVSVTT